MSTTSRAVLRSVLILGPALALMIFATLTWGPLGLLISLLLPAAVLNYVGRMFKDAMLRRILDKLLTHTLSFDDSRFALESVSQASPEEFHNDDWTDEDVGATSNQTCWFVVGTFVVGPKAGNTFWRPTLFFVLPTLPRTTDFDRQHETHAPDGGEDALSGSERADDFEDEKDESLPFVVYAADRWDGSKWVKADMEMCGSARLRLHVGMQSPLPVGYLTYFGCYLGEIRFPDAG